MMDLRTDGMTDNPNPFSKQGYNDEQENESIVCVRVG